MTQIQACHAKKIITAALAALTLAGCGGAASTIRAPAPSVSPVSSTRPSECIFGGKVSECTSADPTAEKDLYSDGDCSAAINKTAINWGDGSPVQNVTTNGPSAANTPKFLAEHTYSAHGVYTISISGTSSWSHCPFDATTYTFTFTAATAAGQAGCTRQNPSACLSVDAGANQTILGTNIISLDGQVTGDSADVAWTQVSGPGTTNFASSDSAATNATVSTPGTYVFQLTAEGGGTSASGQVTITVLTYVALGDSYSAGDGAGDYLADSSDPLCLQSANAYPELVDAKVAGVNAIPAGTANPAFVFAACTGAEIPDFNSLQSDNQAAQLSYLMNLPAKSVGLVTLTIGGNDAGFGQVMAYCAVRKPSEKSCQEHSQAEVNQIILKQLSLELFDLYRQIKSQPSLAPNAQILVLGYPQFFPAEQATSCPTGVVTGAFGDKFQPSDMAWIDSVIKLVDSDIQASAFAAGLTYVGISDAFTAHQLCQPNPDLNDVVIGPVLLAEGYRVGVQSFHPNAAGQSVLAQNVSPVVPFPMS